MLTPRGGLLILAHYQPSGVPTRGSGASQLFVRKQDGRAGGRLRPSRSLEHAAPLESSVPVWLYIAPIIGVCILDERFVGP